MTMMGRGGGPLISLAQRPPPSSHAHCSRRGNGRSAQHERVWVMIGDPRDYGNTGTIGHFNHLQHVHYLPLNNTIVINLQPTPFQNSKSHNMMMYFVKIRESLWSLVKHWKNQQWIEALDDMRWLNISSSYKCFSSLKLTTCETGLSVLTWLSP